MTRLEQLEHILADGNWHSTEELVETVGHRFFATIHVAIRQHHYQGEKRRSHGNQFEYRKMVTAKSQR